jgi:hypothetical protein
MRHVPQTRGGGMTSEREAHLIRMLRTITSTAELDAFRAQIRDEGETVTPDLFLAMETTADRLRRR